MRSNSIVKSIFEPTGVERIPVNKRLLFNVCMEVSVECKAIFNQPCVLLGGYRWPLYAGFTPDSVAALLCFS